LHKKNEIAPIVCLKLFDFKSYQHTNIKTKESSLPLKLAHRDSLLNVKKMEGHFTDFG
jgi:hypothetical protein